jgi:hypothetical protein
MFLAQLFGNYSVNCPAGNIRMADLSAREPRSRYLPVSSLWPAIQESVALPLYLFEQFQAQ